MSTERAGGLIDLLRSPRNGARLRAAGPNLLDDGVEPWPCLDGIPYLRVGRDKLRGKAVELIGRGDSDEALALLLTDRRNETIPPLDIAQARRTARSARSIGEATEGLGYGLMAPYVFHRWCLPTFLSGLALLELHAAPGSTMLEAGCGAGHFLRRWTDRSGRAIGADVVFSNLWLARRFVAPEADLLCCDLGAGIPLEAASADFSFAHDALHYFPDKALAFREMQRIARGGTVLLGHVHNAAQANFSAGSPLGIEDYRACLAPARCYDDAALAEALRRPGWPDVPSGATPDAEAFAFACGPIGDGPGPELFRPRPGTRLSLNPLVTENGPRWPNPKFEQEFAQGWDYMLALRHPGAEALAAAEKGNGGNAAALARDLVLLELPENWQ